MQDFDDLIRHYGHKIVVVRYGDENDPDSVSIECETCHEVLIDIYNPAYLKKEWGYNNKNYNIWAHDMDDAGYEVEKHYKGRGFYKGPAVYVSDMDIHNAMNVSKVPTQRDNMGLDWVIYPVP